MCNDDMFNTAGLGELSDLFSSDTEPQLDHIFEAKPAEPKQEEQRPVWKQPDIATIDLGYTETWHDIIDISVPLHAVPSVLIMPRVPLPLHHRSPRRILSEIDPDWWVRTRKRVYDVQGRHCAVCGIHEYYQKGYRKSLEAHELYTIDYRTGTMTLLGIVPLCSFCHRYVHYGLLSHWHDTGQIAEKTYYEILGHGNAICKAFNLPQKNLDPEVDDNIFHVPWKEWHLDLVIEGKVQSFYSLYEDQDELEASYGN